MDGSTPEAPPKDRPFDPSRAPATTPARGLITEVFDRLTSAERRQRKRRSVDQGRYEASVTALACDLVHRHLSAPDAWLTVPMAKASLAVSKRTVEFMTEKFPEVVRALADASLDMAELRIGRHTPFGGERSTLRAAAWMRERIGALGLTLRDFTSNAEHTGDPIVLRSTKFAGKAKSLPVPDTEDVRRLRAAMDEINAWLREADLDCVGGGAVDLENRHLRRIFNNASLESGGRLYGGFWQALGGEWRVRNLRIDGDVVASVDFAQLGITLAYSRAGASSPEGDLYALPGMTSRRDGVKQALNALLAAETELTRYPRGTRKLFPGGWKFADVLDAIRRHHAPIAHLFGTGLSLWMQNVESQVVVSALLRLKQLAVVALPVHDCLVVPAHHAELTKAVMEMTFREVAGVEVTAVIDRGSPKSTVGFL